MEPLRDILMFCVGAFFMLGVVCMFEFLVARYPNISLRYTVENLAQGLFEIKTP